MTQVIAFQQIAPILIPDQLGVPQLHLYALDASGALWLDTSDGDGWRRVEQPPNSSRTSFTPTTEGVTS